MQNADITFQENKFFISGDLCFANVMKVYEKSLMHLTQCAEFIFDFSQLKTSDSSGLALVTEWIKLAKQQKKKIHLQHLSHDLVLIAKAAGMDKILAGA